MDHVPPARRRLNLLILRVDRRRFHSDLEVMEGLWESFKAAFMSEADGSQPESRPLYADSSIHLRY
jgi:hypothetical protein